MHSVCNWNKVELALIQDKGSIYDHTTMHLGQSVWDTSMPRTSPVSSTTNSVKEAVVSLSICSIMTPVAIFLFSFFSLCFKRSVHAFAGKYILNRSDP